MFSRSKTSVRKAPLLMVSLAALLTACTDSSTAPAPNPDPLPDPAAYDLVFEQSLVPLNAWELRTRRAGDASGAPLFGRETLGIEPSVSADGRTLVYQGYGAVSGDDQDLWIVRDGGAATRVPLPQGDVEFSPALSPDGTRLAFIRRGEDGNTQLYVSRVDGTERRELAAGVPGPVSANSSPDWSPDGTRIAWSNGLPGSMRIAIINTDGTGMRTVSAGGATGSDIDADWSPDGKQLAFVRTPSPGASDLVVFTLATGQERLFGLPRRNRQPQWSPDGKFLVFSSTLDVENGYAELYTIKPDGTALTRLTFDDVHQRHPIFVRRQ